MIALNNAAGLYTVVAGGVLTAMKTNATSRFSVLFPTMTLICILCFSCSKNDDAQLSDEHLSDVSSPAQEQVLHSISEFSAEQGEPVLRQEKAIGIQDVDVSKLMVKPSVFVAEKNNLDSLHCVYDNTILYAIGFSEDGHFAFMEQQMLEGTGCSEASFYIQDLVSDEILVNLQGSGNDGDGSTVDSLIEEYHAEIDDALAQYDIAMVPCQFKELPYEDGESFADIQVSVTDTGRLMHEMFRIINYECVASDGKRGSKIVSAKKNVTVDDVYVCGYIKSPFEGRLAIVIAEKRFGFEGFDLHYSIVGCRID